MNVSAFDLAILVAYMAGMVALGSWLGRGRRRAGGELGYADTVVPPLSLGLDISSLQG